MLAMKSLLQCASQPYRLQCHVYRYYSSSSKTGSIIDSWKQKLGVYWEKSQTKMHYTQEMLREYHLNFKTQWSKAQKSIQGVNEKFSKMESDTQDENLNYNDKGNIKGLPSERERHRKKWARKMDLYLDSLQETIFTATRALNDVTGYSSIQKLRDTIESLEKELMETKKLVSDSKLKYEKAISARSESQKEVNELLQRKHTWSASDLDRFTQLFRDDTLNSKTEEIAKTELANLEAKEEELASNLYRAILTRYHEEQIWSDKIRRTSTWGTFVLMGVNILFFVIFQLLLEPWKRRRLVGSFEDKVKMALDDHQKEQALAISGISSSMNSVLEQKLQDQSIQLKTGEGDVATDSSKENFAVDFSDSISAQPGEPVPQFSFILQQLQLWFKHYWTLYSTKLLEYLPVTTVTFTKPYFYSYSTVLMALGIMLGHFL